LHRHVAPPTRRTHLAKNIQESAINRIRNLEWLDIGTRKKGISKVKHIHIGIGVPEKWPDSVEPDLTRNNLLQNILKLGEVRTLNDIQLVKHNLNPDSWDDPSFAVNAYYAGSCIQYSSGYAILLIDSLTTCSQYTLQMYMESACSIPVGPVTTHFMSELGLSNSAGCSKNTNFYGYGFGKMSCSSSNPVGLVPYPKIAKK
jgi:hypothetical protein